MRNNNFANVCLALIVILLGVIALRLDMIPAYAAKVLTYEVIRTDEANIVPQVAKETQAGWEPVAATMWSTGANYVGQGFVIFKK